MHDIARIIEGIATLTTTFRVMLNVKPAYEMPTTINAANAAIILIFDISFEIVVETIYLLFCSNVYFISPLLSQYQQ